MFVQKELREKNIAEYLLYMWQVEDMIRAAGLDSDRLYDAVVKASGRTDDECREWKQWYDDLIEMMRTEGKTVQGHLQINENVLVLLEDLHARLLDSHKQPEALIFPLKIHIYNKVKLIPDRNWKVIEI